MDIQSYIESGAIESYVLGLATEKEIAELEVLRSQYAIIEDSINDFSLALEKEAMTVSVQPRAHVKAGFMNALRKEENSILMFVPRVASQNEAPQITAKKFEISKHPWKLVAAVSFFLFVASSALNFYFYNRYEERSEAYQKVLTERNSLFSANKTFLTSQHEWKNTVKMMVDPAMLQIKLKSAPKKNNMDATIFWDSRSKDVYVMAKELPRPQAGWQFQLLAIVDGKPIDAGMINPDCSGVCKLKNIPRAQAFAITLEKEGGSPTPNMEQLLVIGNT